MTNGQPIVRAPRFDKGKKRDELKFDKHDEFETVYEVSNTDTIPEYIHPYDRIWIVNKWYRVTKVERYSDGSASFYFKNHDPRCYAKNETVHVRLYNKFNPPPPNVNYIPW